MQHFGKIVQKCFSFSPLRKMGQKLHGTNGYICDLAHNQSHNVQYDRKQATEKWRRPLQPQRYGLRAQLVRPTGTPLHSEPQPKDLPLNTDLVHMQLARARPKCTRELPNPPLTA